MMLATFPITFMGIATHTSPANCTRCHRKLKNVHCLNGAPYGTFCVRKAKAEANEVFGGNYREAPLHATPGSIPVYAGWIDYVSGEREVITEGGHLPLRLDLANHSPTGFSWGYGGSGPSQLALAILAHALDDRNALDRYQDFKWAFIAKLDQSKNFRISKADVIRILNEINQPSLLHV